MAFSLEKTILWVEDKLCVLILTAPIHCNRSLEWCNAKFLYISSDEDTSSSVSWMAWERVHFKKKFKFSLFLLKLHYVDNFLIGQTPLTNRFCLLFYFFNRHVDKKLFYQASALISTANLHIILTHKRKNICIILKLFTYVMLNIVVHKFTKAIYFLEVFFHIPDGRIKVVCISWLDSQCRK